jgi:hypothetical protein
MGAVDMSLRTDILLSDQMEVLEYWESLKNGARIPRHADFRPGRILRRLPLVSLVDASFDASRFRFRLTGTGLRDVFGSDLTGRHLDELALGAQYDHWYDVYRHVARNGEPAQGFTPLLWRDKPGVVQAWLRLPLADANGAVSMILGYDRFIPVERSLAGRTGRLTVPAHVTLPAPVAGNRPESLSQHV